MVLLPPAQQPFAGLEGFAPIQRERADNRDQHPLVFEGLGEVLPAPGQHSTATAGMSNLSAKVSGATGKALAPFTHLTAWVWFVSWDGHD